MSIKVEKLQITYDKTIVISDLNLSLPKGKITMIIGRNGCGKSTFLKSVARIIVPRKGEIYIDGMNIKKMAPKVIAKKMAVLPQSPTAPSGLTVKELVAYGRFPYQKAFGGMQKHDYDMIEWAMRETRVYEYKDRPVEALSGGQRQRAWIAMALAQETEIVVLDEPTTYLDMSHQLEVLELLKELNRRNQTTIVMVLHELNHAAKFADHVIGMKKGNVVFAGKPVDVITKENLKELYHIDATLMINDKKNYPVCVDYELVKTNEE